MRTLTIFVELSILGFFFSCTVEENKDPKDQGGIFTKEENLEGCYVGETLDSDGNCVYQCKTDDQGEDWCFRKNQFPSDINPAKLVDTCEKGMIEFGECRNISIVLNNEGLSLYAGDSQKFWTNGISQKYNGLKSFSNHGVGEDLKLEYDFETYYSKEVFREGFFGAKLSYSIEGETIYFEIDQNKKQSLSIELLDIEFNTGEMSINELSKLCTELDEASESNLGPEFIFSQSIVYPNIYYCGVTKSLIPTRIRLNCDISSTKCFTDEIVLKWQKKTNFD